MTGVASVEVAYLRLVQAPNPGPMTLEGTNTWVVGDPAEAAPLVVDPGPGDAGHLAAVLSAAGGRVAGVVLTHRHDDHAEAAAELADRAGCPVLAVQPELRVGPTGSTALVDGRVLRSGSTTVTAYRTPGHTSDSCSLLLRGQDGVVRLLTGDAVLGRGTSVIAAPDGDLGAYLASLVRLQELVRRYDVRELLPGHGPRVNDPDERLAQYRRHREERLDQVRAALTAGDETADQVLQRVYGEVSAAVRPAARQSVEAQMKFLADTAEQS